MAPTIHQRIHGWMWHWKTGPGWCRSLSDELYKLQRSGMRVIKVHLQDDGTIPRDVADTWRKLGFKVWGAMRPSGDPLGGKVWDPWEAVDWMRGERDRLALAGFDCNFEEEVRAADVDTGGEWSLTFCSQYRSRHPTLPAHLDTYFGSAAAGINLGAYKMHGFRFAIQTYWGAEGTWNDPPTNMVKWCAGAQPPIHKSTVKPMVRIVANNSGELVDVENVVYPDAIQAGTKGIQWYYLDGVKDVDWLCHLNREAIRRGVAY